MDKLVDGSYPISKGLECRVKDNTGVTVVPKKKVYKQ